MSNPQQPEIARSRKTPAQDPDSVAAIVDAERVGVDDAPRGPVPPENQPGHHPAEEQDKPDLDAFAERLGTAAAGGGDGGAAAEARPGPGAMAAGANGAGAAARQRAGRLAGRPVRRAVAAFLGAFAVFVVGRRVRRRPRAA